jgi:23S rRNA (uridine2552-2'-O)-methyltransferase
MAPNLTGIGTIDQAVAASLNEAVLEFAFGPVLEPNGSLVIKVFRSPQLKSLLDRLGQGFRRVAQHKPEASRKDSAEIYLVALQKT